MSENLPAATLYLLELDQLDDQRAVFTMPDGTVQVTMQRADWQQAGRPHQRHVLVTDDPDHAMALLRVGP